MRSSDIITARRKNDAVIAVLQDNLHHNVLVEDANPGAEYLTGYSKAELKGKSLNDLVPPQIKDTLQSYIEYDDPMGDDLAAVLKRTRRFQLTTKNGDNIPVTLKVFSVPGASTTPRYELLMRDMALQEKMAEIKKHLVEEQKANVNIDTDTGLPTIMALREYIELVREFVQRNHVEATFALLDIENYENIAQTSGVEIANRLVQEVGERFRKASRAEDTVGVIGNGIVGVLLFDCNATNAPLAFGRIKNSIVEKPVMLAPAIDVTVKLNIVFHQIEEKDVVDTVFRTCATLLDRSARAGGNDIVEAR